jgi:hypothetical protein
MSGGAQRKCGNAFPPVPGERLGISVVVDHNAEPSLLAAGFAGVDHRLYVRTWWEDVNENCRECDTVILTAFPKGAFNAAEQRGLPFLPVGLGTVYPTAAFPMIGMNFPNLRIGFLNRTTYGLLEV